MAKDGRQKKEVAMKKILDPVTGLEIEISDEPMTEYWIVSAQETNGLGWPIAYACAFSLADARRKQLELGVRSTTKIITIEVK